MTETVLSKKELGYPERYLLPRMIRIHIRTQNNQSRKFGVGNFAILPTLMQEFINGTGPALRRDTYYIKSVSIPSTVKINSEQNILSDIGNNVQPGVIAVVWKINIIGYITPM
jgi:hypothetical protein